MIIILQHENPLFHLTISRFVSRFEKIGVDPMFRDIFPGDEIYPKLRFSGGRQSLKRQVCISTSGRRFILKISITVPSQGELERMSRYRGQTQISESQYHDVSTAECACYWMQRISYLIKTRPTYPRQTWRAS